MSTLLIQTKLCVPPLRRGQVARPHLLQQLNTLADPTYRLALLAAPPGFGKTSLLAAWAAQCSMEVAWLALDEGDNDSVRFWDYVITALQTRHPQVGQTASTLLHEPTPLPVPSILAALLNDLNALEAPLVLVMDDYHLIQQEPIHQALAFLLDHLPPQLRLVLAGRTDPPLPLSRLRVRNQLLELRVADLRFTAAETAEFVQGSLGLRLAQGDVAALEARTEGWVAGLQLAVLALQGRGDVTEFIQSFAGDHRYILDYLVDEVLTRQPAHVQQFLLDTSILARLTAPLCDAVVGRGDSQLVLEQLERNNLFLVALDERRQWYRYHHLFGDFLRHRLQQQAPARILELHDRATSWFQDRGLLLEAVRHALAAQDVVRAADLIEETAEMLIWRRPELHTFQGWLQALPATLLATRPRLSLYYAWVLYLTNQMPAAEHQIRQAEVALAQGVDDRLAAGMAATLRSTVTGIRREFADTLRFTRQSLDTLPEGAIGWRCVTAINHGVASAAIGDLDEAVETLGQAMELSQEIGSAFAMLSAFWHLAALQTAQLRLQQAEATCTQLLHLVRDPDLARFPVEGYIALLRGEIHLERNELDQAEHYLEESSRQINPEGFPLALLRSYVALARVKQIQHDGAGTAAYLARAEEVVAAHHLQGRSASLIVEQARLWLEQGDLVALEHWVAEQRLAVDDEIGSHREPYYLILARLLMVKARLAPTSAYGPQALALLARLVQQADAGGRTGSLVRALALQAVALFECGETQGAAAALARALALAEPERCVRVFADLGAPLAPVLAQVSGAQRNGAPTVSPAYLHTLQAALGVRSAPAVMQTADLYLIEPLSEREIEVLRLLAEDLSSNEIADRLIIAVETARKHTKNIYAKLAVHSRPEAVRRGRALGLL